MECEGGYHSRSRICISQGGNLTCPGPGTTLEWVVCYVMWNIAMCNSVNIINIASYSIINFLTVLLRIMLLKYTDIYQ